MHPKNKLYLKFVTFIFIASCQTQHSSLAPLLSFSQHSALSKNSPKAPLQKENTQQNVDALWQANANSPSPFSSSQDGDHEDEFFSENMLEPDDQDKARPSAVENKNFFAAKNDSALLCEDSLYFESWRKQFDAQWLSEHRKKYKTRAAQTKALNQARTDEFIQLAYPSLEKTGFDFPVVINAQVLQWINYFKGPGKKSFVVWLRRGRFVIPDMEKTLEQYGLPKDLVYLSLIESGYNSNALSSAGAVGPWQFMPATARENGLKINDYVDERRDFKKSTKAAALYLTQLYTKFGDWHLSTASYNGGPGLVQRTLNNYGQDASFFELTSRGLVNSETANYVPKLIAALVISKSPETFGFDTTDAPVFFPTKTVFLTKSIYLRDLAKVLNIDHTVLDTLNPELRLGITPPPQFTVRGYFELQVPASSYEATLASLHSLPPAPTQYMMAARIKRKETMGAFIARYHLNAAAVLRANTHLKTHTRLRRGQIVYVPVSLGSGQYDRLVNKQNMTVTKPQRVKTQKKLVRNPSHRSAQALKRAKLKKLVFSSANKKKSHRSAR